MKRTAEPTVIKTVSVSLLGGFALELDGTTLTDDINRSLKLWSISTCFQVLSPADGQVTHVLLTRSPLIFFRCSKLR